MDLREAHRVAMPYVPMGDEQLMRRYHKAGKESTLDARSGA